MMSPKGPYRRRRVAVTETARVPGDLKAAEIERRIAAHLAEKKKAYRAQ